MTSATGEPDSCDGYDFIHLTLKKKEIMLQLRQEGLQARVPAQSRFVLSLLSACTLNLKVYRIRHLQTLR